MELKALWLGLVMSMGAFAVKTGLGWAYLWAQSPPGRKLPASLIVLAGYALLFGGVYWLVSSVNMLAHYEILLPLWQSGVTLHWLMAGLLMWWGLALLKSKPDSCHHNSRGWLALVIPCPVCLSVVLMSAAGLVMFFPEQSLGAIAALFAAFVTIAAASGLVAVFSSRGRASPVQSQLGLAMFLMALYFIVSALVMPHFAELDRIHRLAVYSEEGRKADFKSSLIMLGFLAALMALGFFFTRRQLMKSR